MRWWSLWLLLLAGPAWCQVPGRLPDLGAPWGLPPVQPGATGPAAPLPPAPAPPSPEAQEAVRQAEALLRQGKIEAALARLEQALRLAPREQRLRLQLAGLYARQGQFARARQHLDQALAQEPKQVEARLLLGRVLLLESKPAQALEVLRALVRDAPGVPEVRAALAEAYVANGKVEYAIEELRTVVHQTDHPSVHLQLAQLYFRQKAERQGDWHLQYLARKYRGFLPGRVARAQRLVERGRLDVALAEWKQLASEFPEQVELWLRVGELGERLKQLNIAADAYRQVHQRESRLRPQMAAKLGDLLTGLGRFREAVPYFKEAIAAQPQAGPLYLALGRCYLELQEWGPAAQVLQQARQLLPTSPDPVWGLLRVFQQLGKWEYALAQVERLQRREPQRPDLWLLRARILGRLDRRSEAVAVLRRVLEHASRNAELAYEAAWALAGVGRMEEAAELLEQLAQATGKSALWVVCGRLWGEAMRWSRAEQAYGKALQTDPRNRRALLGRAASAGNQGRFLDAALGFEQALSVYPDDPTARRGVAVAAEQLELYPQAAEAFERLAQRGDSPAGFWASAGRCWAQARQWERAEAAFRQGLQRAPGDSGLLAAWGLSRTMRQEHREALEVYQQAAKADSRRQAPVEFAARAASELGQQELAQQWWEEAMNREPRDPLAALRWWECAARAGGEAEAWAAARPMLEAHPEWVALLDRTWWQLQRSSERQAFLDWLRPRWLATTDERLLAAGAAILGETDSSGWVRETLRNRLRGGSGSLRGRHTLARLELQAGQFRAAAETYRALLLDGLDYPEAEMAALGLVEAYQQWGKLPALRLWVEGALADQGPRPALLLARGAIEEALGHQGAALDWYAQAAPASWWARERWQALQSRRALVTGGELTAPGTDGGEKPTGTGAQG